MSTLDIKEKSESLTLDAFRDSLKSGEVPAGIIRDSKLFSIADVNYWKTKAQPDDLLHFTFTSSKNKIIGSTTFSSSGIYQDQAFYSLSEVSSKVNIRTKLGLKAPSGILGEIFIESDSADIPYSATFVKDRLMLHLDQKEKIQMAYEASLSYFFSKNQFKVVQEKDAIIIYINDENNRWEEGALREILHELIGTNYGPVRCFIENEAIANIENRRYLKQRNDIPIERSNKSPDLLEIEKELLPIFRTLFDNDNIKIEDDFFDLGLNSLFAVQLISRIHKKIGVKLTLKELFKNSVIKDLGRFLTLKDSVDYLSISKLEDKEYYELSSSQLRLWLLSQNRDLSIAYNEFTAMQIDGYINVLALNKAIQKIVNRHEILRTSFIIVQGNPKQLVHPRNSVDVRVEVNDFCQNNDKEIRYALLEESRYNFDLAQDVLIRIKLFRIDENKHIITINMHHIISDGWSQVVLFNELMATYYEFISNLSNEKQDLPIQFKDYAHWHNNILQTEKAEQFKKYWNNKFTDRAQKVDLTALQKAKFRWSYKGKSKRYEFGNKYLESFKVLAKHEQTTIFSILLTYFKILLYKYSGQSDITVGTSVSGRNHPDLEDQIGFYVNTIPIRNVIDPESTFTQQLRQLSTNLLSDFDHDIYPFELLVADLSLSDTEEGMNPLFDIFIEYFNYGERFITEEQFVGEQSLKILPLRQDNETTIFGLNIMFVEGHESISIEVRYDTEQFEEDKIDSLIEHFICLIDKIESDQEQKINSFEILLPAELEKLEEFARTDRELPWDCTIIEGIEKHVKETPNDTAIVHEEHSMTYKELWEFSNKIANFLTESNSGKQYKVGVFMHRSCYTLAALIGIWKAGAIYIPLDPEFPMERVKYIIEDSQICTLFTGKEHIRNANKLQWECSSLISIVVLDAAGVHDLVESENKTMNVELWEYVGNTAHDDITGGGWFNSYNGDAFSREEMDEYRHNTISKLSPYLNRQSKVLEIGCASGITMFALANQVESYVGIDLNNVILEKNRLRCIEEGISNITMYNLFAHEIDQLKEQSFDVIIINSVIQNFNGHNYLREVLDKSIEKLAHNGIVFLGDLIDQEKKQDLIEDLRAYKRENPKANTKLEWDEELFVSKLFLENYIYSKDFQIKATYSNKQGKVENELKKFRYDVIFEINRDNTETKQKLDQIKFQFDLSHLNIQNGEHHPSLATPSDISYIIYTSGSTGKPKGAIIEHIGMLNHLDAKRNDFHLDKQSRIVQNASQCFDISIWQYVNALLVGGQVFVYSNDVVLEPDLLLAKLKVDQITIFEVVPSYMQVLLDYESKRIDRRMNSLIYFLVNGETLKPSLASRWFDYYPDIPLVNCYGPTEASDDVTHYFIHEKPDLNLRVPIGNKPIQNFRFYFLDNDLNRVPIGAKGEICISGLGVGQGYINNVQKTKAAFISDPFNLNRKMYRTGDIGRVLEDGTIEFFGRKDTQVKIRGYRIELEEIEIVIAKCKGVRNSVVLVGNDNSGVSFLFAFVTLSDESLTPETIKEQIAIELPEYMVPGVIRILEELALNNNGKIDRKALERMMSDENVQQENFEAPVGNIELTVAQIWENVIGGKHIGRNDNFFQLGGHSVSAIQAVSYIKNEYQIDLPLKELFEHPTVQGFAEIIAKYKKRIDTKIIPKISRKKDRNRYKISPVQYAEWYLQKLNPGSTFYNIGFILEFQGRVNYEAFLETIKRLINRHDVFKFTIVEEDGIPFQVLRDEPYIDLNNVILDYSSSKEVDIDRDEIIANNFNTVFDFTKAVAKIKLVKFSSEKHIFIFEVHHIIWDQISTFIFYKEFLQTYNELSSGKKVSLPSLEVNYSDYTEWINELIDTGALEKQKQYWLDRYRKLPNILELPTDYPRPMLQTFNGKFISEPLGLEFKNEISTFCNEQGITYQIFLITVLNLLIYRLTNQNDFVVGTPIWNRSKENLNEVLGLFASAIPIRCSLDDTWTFDELLSHTKNISLEAYENHLYPFNKIIEELNPSADFSRQKIISVFFGVQNDETELVEGNLNGLTVSPISQELDLSIKNTSVFDFTLQVDHNKENMWFTLRYNTDLFKEETAINFLARYKELVKQTLSNPSKNLLDYSLLLKSEEELIEKVSVSEVFEVPDLGLHNIINNVTLSHNSKTAITDKNKVVTYGELNNYTNRIANLLLENQVKKQERVGILLPRSADFIASVLGVLNIGAVFVPLSIDYPILRIEEIIDQAGIKKIITNSSIGHDKFLGSSLNNSLIILDDVDFSQISDKPTTIVVSKNDLIYTVFTSGSTGKPKGIDIKHVGAINIISSTTEEFGFTKDERVLFHTSTVFDASIMDYLWPLATGASIVIMPEEMEKDVHSYHQLIQRHQITHIQTVPLLLESFVTAIERGEIQKPTSLKRVVVGGAILNVSLGNRFITEFGIELYNCYGPTETTVDSTRFRFSISDNESELFSPIGKPVANTKLYVLDNNLQQLPIGIAGELYISSIGAAKGYLNDEEKTNLMFIKNPFNDGFSEFLYKTGDKVSLQHDGNYVLYGRLDNQIKLNGNRIEIDEIESLLRDYDGIYNAAVILNKNGAYEQLTAFVEPEDNVNKLFSYNNNYRYIPLIDDLTVNDEINELILNNSVVHEDIKSYYQNIIYNYPEYQLCVFNNGELVGLVISYPLYLNDILERKIITPDLLLNGSKNESNVVIILEYVNNQTSIELHKSMFFDYYKIRPRLGIEAIYDFDDFSGQFLMLKQIDVNEYSDKCRISKSISKEDVKKYLAKYLPQYMIPNHIVIRDKIILNSSGKVDKSLLKGLNSSSYPNAFKEQLSSTQKAVLKIFEQVLKVDKLSAHESFFALGGHSINMIQLIAKLEKAFGIKIPIPEIFSLQTASNIGSYIGRFQIGEQSKVDLQQLSNNGSRNMFCLPSISTTAADFIEMAHYLKGYNVYAFDFAFLDHFDDMLSQKDDIVKRCIEMILDVNGQDTFCLMGYSAGGILAYELLKKLEHTKLVDKLLILDMDAPEELETIEKAKKYEDSDVEEFLALDQLSAFNREEKDKIVSRIWKYAELTSYIKGDKALDLPLYIFSSECADRTKQKRWSRLSRTQVIFSTLKGSHYQILKNEYIEYNSKIIITNLNNL